MSKDFIILYGSQTNQSEAIAEQICAKCVDMKLDPRLFRMDEIDKKVFALILYIIFVIKLIISVFYRKRKISSNCCEFYGRWRSSRKRTSIFSQIKQEKSRK